MTSKFDSFIEKIPKNIHNNTRTFIGKNIAVFIPDKFVINKKMVMEDYHFVILHTTPPSAIINEKEIQLKKGSLICMAPGTSIEVKPIASKSQAKYISLNINKDYFENLAIKISGEKSINFKNVKNYYSHKLLDLIEFFVQEFTYPEEQHSIMKESIETLISIQLLRDSDLDPRVKKISFDQAKSYIEQAIDYIEEYYSSNITINEICSNIYVSPCHFQRIFKDTMEKTPYQYIMDYRIKKAKEMLRNEKVSVAEVARLCGFVSGGHFSTVFKRVEGKTPSEYKSTLNL